MDITDIQACADFYQEHFLKTFYIVTTYNDKSFILIGERNNFPHLMGIRRDVYRSNGYRSPRSLFHDIISRNAISSRIIPNNISPTSKMYKKVLHFRNCTDIFWRNSGPLTVNFKSSLSQTRLNNVDVLLTDINTGYVLGWVANSRVPINSDSSIQKYCISTWIDKSDRAPSHKEKYLPDQDVELIRFIFAYDSKSSLIGRKEYNYTQDDRKSILHTCARNSSNLLINSRNAHYYIETACNESIHCKINGVQY